MTCSTPPDNDCNSGSEFESYDKTGSCVNGRCSYVSHQTSCVCQNHACTTDPCIGMPCDSPPSAACTGADGNTLTTYATSGTCDAGSCSYAPTNKACTFGCTNGACNPDPCTGVPCNTPPPAACKTATTFTAYAATGTCSGAGICNYAPTAPNRVAFHGTPATPGPSDFLYDCPVGGCAAAVPYIAAWGGKSQSGIGTVVALSGNVYYLTEGSGGSRVLRCPGTDVSSCVQLTNGGLADNRQYVHLRRR